MRLRCIFTASVWLVFLARETFARGPPVHHSQTAALKTFPFQTNGWFRTEPAFNIQRAIEKTTEVSTKVKQRITDTFNTPLKVKQKLSETLGGPLSSAGFYYGMSDKVVTKSTAKRPKRPKRMTMEDTMAETLDQLRIMRKEMEALRKELHDVRKKVVGDDAVVMEPIVEVDPAVIERERRQRQRDFDKLAADIEKWAENMVESDEEWTEVQCNKRFHFNNDGRTSVFLRWMKDSRGEHANPDDKREYPCIKIFSTIDAPLEDVCLYLSQEERIEEYNEIVDTHRDIEEISEHSKICIGQTPQILFIKPRDFITFCHHRWRRDGAQVIVNQATDHEKLPEEKGLPRAYALRGANFICRHPNDPEKTRIIMVAHGNPGNDVPQWAAKTAVNSLVPIEPFKLFYRINQGVLSCREELERRLDDIEMVSCNGRSKRPAGIAQLGYACFWPNGGGLEESASGKDEFESNSNNNKTTKPSPPSKNDGDLETNPSSPKDDKLQSAKRRYVFHREQGISRARDAMNESDRYNKLCNTVYRYS